MLHKSRGIALSYVKYRESSIITKIYTEAFGLQSYIINGIRSKRSKQKMGLYQSLSLLDMVIYHKDNGKIHRISEVRAAYPFQDLPFNMRKSGVALFLTEVLNKTLKEEVENEELFNFLFESIVALDQLKAGVENFHLRFLLTLSYYLGIAPDSAGELYAETHDQVHDERIAQEEKELINQLMDTSYDDPIQMSQSMRREILETLLRFYRYHIESFGEVRSYDVLKTVMSA